MKKILMIILLAFIIIQFFPIDKTNPALNKGTDFLTIKKTPEKTAVLLKNACYDCHSNETQYPWYSNLQPVGWFLQNHYQEGRKHLNFSTFATYEPKSQIHHLEEAIDEIKSTEMPLESYTLIHKEAALTAQQRETLVHYFETEKQEILRKTRLLK